MNKTIMPPDIEAAPVLASMTADKNDKTGEDGVWMTFKDARKEAVWREKVGSFLKAFQSEK